MTDASDKAESQQPRSFRTQWIALLLINLLVLGMFFVFLFNRTRVASPDTIGPENAGAGTGFSGAPIIGGPWFDPSTGEEPGGGVRPGAIGTATGVSSATFPGVPGMAGPPGGVPDRASGEMSGVGSGFPATGSPGSGGGPGPLSAGGGIGIDGSTINIMSGTPVPGLESMSVHLLIFWLNALLRSHPDELDSVNVPALTDALRQWRSSVIIVSNAELAITMALTDAQKEALVLTQFKAGTCPPALEGLKKLVQQALENLEQGSGSSDGGEPVSAEIYSPRPWRSAIPMTILAAGCTHLARSDQLSGEQQQALHRLFQQSLEALEKAEFAIGDITRALGPDGLRKVREVSSTVPPFAGLPQVKPWEPFALGVLEAALAGLGSASL